MKWRSELPVAPCPACFGKGVMPGDRVGEVLRKEREERDVPRISKSDPETGLAYHFGFSESYTLDLECGRRPWSWSLIDKYRAAIEDAVSVRLRKESSNGQQG